MPRNADSFEQWRVSVAPMFTFDSADPRQRSGFHLAGTSYQFSGVAVASVASSATDFDRGPRVVARYGVDQFLVLAYLTGGYRLSVGGREIEVKAGDVCVLDLTRPCRLRGTDYRHVSVVLPRAALEPLLPNVDGLHGLVLPGGTPLNALLLSHLRQLYEEAPRLGAAEGMVAVRATEGLIAACLTHGADSRDAARRAAAPAVRLKLRRLIDANLGDPRLDPVSLCRRGGVSRATLYRLFEPFGGVSAYIRQRRLSRAFRMLSDPALGAERVKDTAARCGFANDAVFSRAVRQTYGMSASDIRATARSGDGGPLHYDAGSAFHQVHGWLLGRTTPTQ